MKTSRLSASCAALLAMAASSSIEAQQMVVPLSQTWLEFSGLFPAPTYDWEGSTFVRRRPGHPAPERPFDEIINPGAVNPAAPDQIGEIIPLPDRWRIMEALGFSHPWYDPYNQNVWKGDLPMFGDDVFLSLVGISDTIIEPRSIPTPVGPQSSENPGAVDIFSGIDQTIFAQTFLAGIILFKGETAFKPPTYEFRLTLAGQYNRVDVDDVRALQIDPRLGNTRDDGFIAIQELFYDYHIRDVSTRYDFDSIRVGIQPFSTDFRGFLFQDLQFGARLFGNRDNNFWQYNLAWFRRVEKDTNSGLNDVGAGLRDDDIFIANVYRQDWPILGFVSERPEPRSRSEQSVAGYDP
jgi:hypothetical protein